MKIELTMQELSDIVAQHFFNKLEHFDEGIKKATDCEITYHINVQGLGQRPSLTGCSIKFK